MYLVCSRFIVSNEIEADIRLTVRTRGLAGCGNRNFAASRNCSSPWMAGNSCCSIGLVHSHDLRGVVFRSS